jgi:hypothetical protein
MSNSNNPLSALKKKLERWELEHLRRHAEELAARLEAAEENARNGWECAEMWREDALQLMQDMMEDGHQVGLTKNGEIIVGGGQFIRREATLVLLTPDQSAELRPLMDEQKMLGGSVIAQVWPDGMRVARITDEEHDQIQKTLSSCSTQDKFRSAAAAHIAATQE